MAANASLVVCLGSPNMIDAAYIAERFSDVTPGSNRLQKLIMYGESIEDVTCIFVRHEHRINTRNKRYIAIGRCLNSFEILFIIDQYEVRSIQRIRVHQVL